MGWAAERPSSVFGLRAIAVAAPDRGVNVPTEFEKLERGKLKVCALPKLLLAAKARLIIVTRLLKARKEVKKFIRVRGKA
jgi:hypothetical protein